MAYILRTYATGRERAIIMEKALAGNPFSVRKP